MCEACKWGMILPGIRNFAPTEKLKKSYLSGMNSKPGNISADKFQNRAVLQQKIALLEKQPGKSNGHIPDRLEFQNY
jgi:hypothetical protein